MLSSATVQALTGHTLFYIEVVTDAQSGAQCLQVRIRGDLLASQIQSLTQELGRSIPVGFALTRYHHRSTVIEWPILTTPG